MEFTIYRDSWRRGGPGLDVVYGKTQLLNSYSQMCCLGQVSYQAGVPLNILDGMGSPAHMCDVWRGVAFWSRLVDIGLLEDEVLGWQMGDPTFKPSWTTFTEEAISTNDSSTGRGMRENALKHIFERHGHKLTFADGVAPWLKCRLSDPVTVALEAEIEVLPVIEVEDEELVCV